MKEILPPKKSACGFEKKKKISFPSEGRTSYLLQCLEYFHVTFFCGHYGGSNSAVVRLIDANSKAGRVREEEERRDEIKEWDGAGRGRKGETGKEKDRN
jgi:hypothetical protein